MVQRNYDFIPDVLHYVVDDEVDQGRAGDTLFSRLSILQISDKLITCKIFVAQMSYIHQSIRFFKPGHFDIIDKSV